MHSLFAPSVKLIPSSSRCKYLTQLRRPLQPRHITVASTFGTVGGNHLLVVGIKPTLVEVIAAVADGTLSPFDAARTIEETLCPETLVTTTVFPTVLHGQGKHLEWICRQMDVHCQEHGRVLVTSVDSDAYTEIQRMLPRTQYYPETRIVKLETREAGRKMLGTMALMSDCSVAASSMKELEFIADFLGCDVEQTTPVSVAIIMDAILQTKNVKHANVIVVVYDEERALPDVIAGLTDTPVVRHSHANLVLNGGMQIAVRVGDHSLMDYPSDCVSTNSLTSAAYAAAKILKSGEQLMASVKSPTEMEMITAKTVSIDEGVKDTLKTLNTEAKHQLSRSNGVNNVIINETTGSRNHSNGPAFTADSIR